MQIIEKVPTDQQRPLVYSARIVKRRHDVGELEGARAAIVRAKSMMKTKELRRLSTVCENDDAILSVDLQTFCR